MKTIRFKVGTKINLLVIAIILFLSITIGVVTIVQIQKAMDKVFSDRVKVVSGLAYNCFCQY